MPVGLDELAERPLIARLRGRQQKALITAIGVIPHRSGSGKRRPARKLIARPAYPRAQRKRAQIIKPAYITEPSSQQRTHEVLDSLRPLAAVSWGEAVGGHTSPPALDPEVGRTCATARPGTRALGTAALTPYPDGRPKTPPAPDTPELAEQRAQAPTAQAMIKATRRLLAEGGLELG
jgi:hypothetical protein